MDLKEIQNLIKFVAKSGATEVKLEMDDFKINLCNYSTNSADTITYLFYTDLLSIFVSGEATVVKVDISLMAFGAINEVAMAAEMATARSENN